MKTGDIVFHQGYGAGQIKDIDKSLGEPFLYLVYYYKENPSLHNGGIGPNFHYWWDYAEALKPVSSIRVLIERKRNGIR